MAVNKIGEKNRLVVVVTNEVTGKEKNLSFSSVNAAAEDAAMLACGHAIASLQTFPLSGIQVNVVSALTEE